MAVAPRSRLEIDFDVGCDAVVFDFPVAVEPVDGGARRGDAASVNQLRISSDPHKAAPGFLSDERADGSFAEVPWQGVPAGARHFVDDQDFRAIDRFRRAGPVVAFAGDDLAHHWTAQLLDDVVGKLTAFVEALVDDGGILPDLREVIAIEAGIAVACGVGDVDVSDSASSGLFDAAAIALDPGEVAKAFFALDGNDGDVAGALAVGIRANFQYDLLARRFFEETVDVVGSVQVAAIHREDIVPDFDVDAGLGERRLQIGIPVFSVVDFGNAVTIVFEAVVGAEQ